MPAGIKANSDGSAAIQVGGSDFLTVTSGGNTTFTQPANLPNTFGFKNRIINGDMRIDQRNAGATISAGDNSFAVDRFAFYHQSGSGSKGNIARNLNSLTSLPVGFTNYYGFQTTSAYSVAAGDGYAINQRIEGFNVADLGFGTANAQTVTLSFWVRSSLTGTFGGVARNNADNRSYPFTYTISSANTWEYKTVTIPGDTSGTWTTDNTAGLKIFWGVGVGSTFSGTAGSWAGSAFLSATGAVSVVGTNGATFYITGVQLEKGSTATSFDYRPYSTELQLAQRYYAKMTAGTGAYTGFGIGYQETTTVAYIFFKYPTTMRTVPTFSQSNCAINDTVSFTAAATLSTTYAGLDSARIRVTFTPSGGAVYRPVDFLAFNNTSAFFDMAAEL